MHTLRASEHHKDSPLAAKTVHRKSDHFESFDRESNTRTSDAGHDASSESTLLPTPVCRANLVVLVIAEEYKA